MVAEVIPSSRLEDEAGIYEECAKAKEQFFCAPTQSQRLEALVTMYAGKIAAQELHQGERIAALYESTIAHNQTARFVHLFAEGSERMKEWGKLVHTSDPEALYKECEELSATTAQEQAMRIAKLSTAVHHAYIHQDTFTNGRQILKQFEDCYRNADKRELVENMLRVVAQEEIDAQLQRWHD